MTAISFKGRHFQHDMIPQSVRGYLAYSLSFRDIEKLIHERDFSDDHSTIHRWVLHMHRNWKRLFGEKRSVSVIGGEWMKARMVKQLIQPSNHSHPDPSKQISKQVFPNH